MVLTKGILQLCFLAANHQPAACNILILCSGVVCNSDQEHSKCSPWISLTSPLTGLMRDIMCATICFTTGAQKVHLKRLLSKKVFFVFFSTCTCLVQVWDLVVEVKAPLINICILLHFSHCGYEVTCRKVHENWAIFKRRHFLCICSLTFTHGRIFLCILIP